MLIIAFAKITGELFYHRGLHEMGFYTNTCKSETEVC
jgi:hypothetical protein